MAYSAVRFLLLACVVSIVVGCKVAVMVVEGGEVQSIGSGTCLEGTICIVEVNDTNFSESFTAVPKAGWVFVKWNTGEGFLCADSTDPTCVLSTVGTKNSVIEGIIVSDETYYIMPIFRRTISVSDTITVNGKEWAQHHLFDVSWNQINAVCPDGICAGILNGYEMTGWIWASVDDVNALFNYYIGSDELGPGPDFVIGDAPWVTAFFQDGWCPSDINIECEAQGWLRDKWGPEDAAQGWVTKAVSQFSPFDGAGTAPPCFICEQPPANPSGWPPEQTESGWFYRAP